MPPDTSLPKEADTPRPGSVGKVLARPLPELLPRDLCTPGRRDLHEPLHVVVGETRLDQFLHRRKKHLVKEPAHLVGDLLVERLRGDRGLFLPFSGLLLRLELLGVLPADATPCPSPHDGRDHAPLLRLGVIEPADQGVGVGVRGEYVELPDRHVAGRLLRHRTLLSPAPRDRTVGMARPEPDQPGRDGGGRGLGFPDLHPPRAARSSSVEGRVSAFRTWPITSRAWRFASSVFDATQSQGTTSAKSRM